MKWENSSQWKSWNLMLNTDRSRVAIAEEEGAQSLGSAARPSLP